MNSFYLVGPTAVGKSELALAVAQNLGAEIISADAFQIYRGLDLLSAKPNAHELQQVRHHLIGAVPLSEEMNAEKFRALALSVMEEEPALVVGGSGLYVKALTEGLSPLPQTNAELRARLQELSERELLVRLRALDPESAQSIDAKNKRRLVRALEICLLSGAPASAQRRRVATSEIPGVFLFRDRDDLYTRINARVEMIFVQGVMDEVRAAKNLSATASQMLGLREIQQLIAGEISQAECIAAIQQATRRYAKRQLTWFRRQTNFAPLNLTGQSTAAAVEWITRKARLSFAQKND